MDVETCKQIVRRAIRDVGALSVGCEGSKYLLEYIEKRWGQVEVKAEEVAEHVNRLPADKRLPRFKFPELEPGILPGTIAASFARIRRLEIAMQEHLAYHAEAGRQEAEKRDGERW